LSVGQLCDLGFQWLFKPNEVIVMVVKKSSRVSDTTIFTSLISTLRRPICKHVCSLRTQWVGCGIEG
jgi:hypothetical protein